MNTLTAKETMLTIQVLRRALHQTSANQDVVKAVLNSYDLHSFISTFTGNRQALVNHFVAHVAQVQKALENF